MAMLIQGVGTVLQRPAKERQHCGVILEYVDFKIPRKAKFEKAIANRRGEGTNTSSRIKKSKL